MVSISGSVFFPLTVPNCSSRSRKVAVLDAHNSFFCKKKDQRRIVVCNCIAPPPYFKSDGSSAVNSNVHHSFFDLFLCVFSICCALCIWLILSYLWDCSLNWSRRWILIAAIVFDTRHWIENAVVLSDRCFSMSWNSMIFPISYTLVLFNCFYRGTWSSWSQFILGSVLQFISDWS